MDKNTVIVVGAGCAGLSATYTLQKQGIDVIALEANDEAGGRCINRTRSDGFNVSYGAFFTEPQWPTTSTYIRELGLETKPYRIQKYGFPRNGKIHYLVNGSPMESLQSAVQFFFSGGLPFATYFQLARIAVAIQKEIGKVAKKNNDFDTLLPLGNTSVEEFVLKNGGPEVLDRIIAPVLATMVGGRPAQIGIPHTIALMTVMSGMVLVKGGMGAVNSALYEKVKNNVQLSTPVRRIVMEDKKVKGVETNHGFIESNRVICATDAVLARGLMPDLPPTINRSLETVKYGSCYNYIFGLENKITPKNFMSLFIPASDRSLFATICDEAGNGMGNTPSGAGLMHCFVGGWNDAHMRVLSEKERRRVVIQETQKYFPSFPDEPYFTECVRYDRQINLDSPGQFPAIHKLLKFHLKDVEGLYLAGEYLYDIPIACTEGAWHTGKMAALRVIEDQ